MHHLPVSVDRPTRDGVVMLARETGYRRSLCRLAAHGHQFGASRLRVAGLVPCPALQNNGAAVPAPRHTESRESLALHGFLKCCLCPTPAAVSGDNDLRDATISRIRHAGNLIESGSLHRKPRRWVSDEGL